MALSLDSITQALHVAPGKHPEDLAAVYRPSREFRILEAIVGILTLGIGVAPFEIYCAVQSGKGREACRRTEYLGIAGKLVRGCIRGTRGSGQAIIELRNQSFLTLSSVADRGLSLSSSGANCLAGARRLIPGKTLQSVTEALCRDVVADPDFWAASDASLVGVCQDYLDEINPATPAGVRTASLNGDAIDRAAGDVVATKTYYEKADSPGKALFGPAHKLLCEKYKPGLAGIAKSISIYYGSGLREEEAKAVAFKRDVANVALQRPYALHNQAMLGCDGAIYRDLEIARKPGNQVSIAMKVPVGTLVGEVIGNPIILTVAAPALDSSRQPDWSAYVTPDRKLKTEEYATAMKTLCSHIHECAVQAGKGHRVVLSGFGQNVIGHLSLDQQRLATTQYVESVVTLIPQLWAAGIEVAFTDCDRDFQRRIIDGLPKGREVEYLPRFEWICNTDILVNGGDPHGCVGNGCELEGGDGVQAMVGKHTLAHDAHALACRAYALEEKASLASKRPIRNRIGSGAGR